VFDFFRKKRSVLQKPSVSSNVKKKTLYETLIFSAEKFSFVKAIDVAVSSCDWKSIEIKSNINFSSKFNDISVVEGLSDKAVEVFTNIQGIAGIEGLLPDCYVEEFAIFNRESKKAVVDFFNIFNNRMLSLRYSYMKRHNLQSLSVPIERSVVGKIIFSLSGFGFKESYKNASSSLIPEQFKISCQNIFWRQTRSSEGLRVILSSFFNVPIKIKQFTGGFIQADESQQTAIGRRKDRYNSLGESCVLGNKVWDAASGIKVIIGPLDFENYIRFLPRQTTKDQEVSPLQKMKEIVKMYVPQGINVTMYFYLDKCLAKGSFLNGVDRLGKDAFILGVHGSNTARFCETVN
jgi:type VI secretion system protein ImpH